MNLEFGGRRRAKGIESQAVKAFDAFAGERGRATVRAVLDKAARRDFRARVRAPTLQAIQTGEPHNIDARLAVGRMQEHRAEIGFGLDALQLALGFKDRLLAAQFKFGARFGDP